MPENLEQVAKMIEENRLDDAEAALKKAGPSQEEDLAEKSYLQGCLAERRHDWPQCIEHFERALELDEDHSATFFHLARVCDLLGDDERAIQLYEKCTADAPAHVNALMNMAVLFEDHGKYEEALECVQSVLDQYPNHARARLFRKDIEASRTMYYDEDHERLREKRDAVLDTSITDFELSVRSRNCLKQMNIHTLGDLLRSTEQELLAYKNFGETSLNEIKTMLSQKGLKLGQNAEDAARELLVQPAAPKALTTGDPIILQKPVSELTFSVRSRKCLQRLGITTVGELAACTEAELLATKNFGQTSLVEIKRRLAELGLSLRGQN